MLDFNGLFPSYVALFPGGVYMKIESLRLDFKPKNKISMTQSVTQNAETAEENTERKEKKKKPETVVGRAE